MTMPDLAQLAALDLSASGRFSHRTWRVDNRGRRGVKRGRAINNNTAPISAETEDGVYQSFKITGAQVDTPQPDIITYYRYACVPELNGSLAAVEVYETARWAWCRPVDGTLE